MRFARFLQLRCLVILSLLGTTLLFAAQVPLAAAVEPSQPAQSLALPVQLPFEKTLPGPVTDYEIMTVSTEGFREYLLQTSRLPAEGFRFVQQNGRSCGGGIKPWLAIRNVKTGQGIVVSLGYCGNWVLEVKPRGDETVLYAATSPASLKPFTTIGGLPIPGALVAEFCGDWDNGAQPITRFIRQKLRRDMGPDWPPVQYNTWYGLYEHISKESVLAAAKAAAEVGCELFVIDAGWYGGSVPDEDWIRALGDWHVNERKFPGGLEPIAAEIHRLGMKFGLWIEIERAAPRTAPAKEHPAWFLREGDKPFVKDGSYMLDFSKPEVVSWAKSEMDRLMAAYKLDYIKMDFNMHVTIDSERFAGGEDLLYRHYRGLADLWEYLRTKYPNLIVENCSSGSLRQDLMSAAMTDTHWVSDHVAPSMCLAMNYGATYLFPPEICNHWTILPEWRRGRVSAADRAAMKNALDLESFFTVNMMGHMGLSGLIQQWDAQTRKLAAERIALYKQIRPLLRVADVYHLTPQANCFSPHTAEAALYVDSKTDRAILFAFQGNDPRLDITLPLRGLRPERRYRLVLPEAFGPTQTLLGRDAVDKGLQLRFPRRGASAIVQIEPL
jgi:alpha-galactosidase